jgi:zinc transport system ATP-binding protein
MTPPLVADDLSFSYGTHPVIDGVGFTVDAGEFVALVGPNGAGKSTLLRLLLGLAPPQRGSVRLFGEPPARFHDRGRLGYVPQRPVLAPELPATVEEIVRTGLLARGRWWRRPRPSDAVDVDHALESVGLVDLRRRRVSELSGGQQQRVFIAKAFVTRPELLILDEPVAGVDAESQRRFSDSLNHLVAEHGAAVLLVSHELGAVAADLDRVLVLKQRVLFDGPPGDLAATGVSLGVHREDLPLWLEGLS